MDLIFEYENEIVMVKILGNKVRFSTQQTNFQQFVPIDLIKLDIAGILKEFPDLKGKKYGDIRQEAISRFKEHISNLGGENRIKDYIIKDLKKHGYILKAVNREGFRNAKR